MGMSYKEITACFGWIALSLAAGVVGSMFTASAVDVWYPTLVKPALNPPSWVFGPVWTTLYVLMGVAAFRVWRKRAESSRAVYTLWVFVVHLIVNASWSIVFFGMRLPDVAFAVLLLLLVLLIYVMWLFYSADRPAMYLLIPYVMWVCFAGYLNYMIWILN